MRKNTYTSLSHERNTSFDLFQSYNNMFLKKTVYHHKMFNALSVFE